MNYTTNNTQEQEPSADSGPPPTLSVRRGGFTKIANDLTEHLQALGLRKAGHVLIAITLLRLAEFHDEGRKFLYGKKRWIYVPRGTVSHTRKQVAVEALSTESIVGDVEDKLLEMGWLTLKENEKTGIPLGKGVRLLTISEYDRWTCSSAKVGTGMGSERAALGHQNGQREGTLKDVEDGKDDSDGEDVKTYRDGSADAPPLGTASTTPSKEKEAQARKAVEYLDDVSWKGSSRGPMSSVQQYGSKKLAAERLEEGATLADLQAAVRGARQKGINDDTDKGYMRDRWWDARVVWKDSFNVDEFVRSDPSPPPKDESAVPTTPPVPVAAPKGADHQGRSPMHPDDMEVEAEAAKKAEGHAADAGPVVLAPPVPEESSSRPVAATEEGGGSDAPAPEADWEVTRRVEARMAEMKASGLGWDPAAEREVA